MYCKLRHLPYFAVYLYSKIVDVNLSYLMRHTHIGTTGIHSKEHLSMGLSSY